jgi:hypothetical protein
LESDWRWNVEELGFAYGYFHIPGYGMSRWKYAAEYNVPFIYNGLAYTWLLGLEIGGGLVLPVLARRFAGTWYAVYGPLSWPGRYPWAQNVKPD